MREEITEEDFSNQIQECVKLFNEHQECVLMRFKKNEAIEDNLRTKHSNGDDYNNEEESER